MAAAVVQEEKGKQKQQLAYESKVSEMEVSAAVRVSGYVWIFLFSPDYPLFTK